MESFKKTIQSRDREISQLNIKLPEQLQLQGRIHLLSENLASEEIALVSLCKSKILEVDKDSLIQRIEISTINSNLLREKNKIKEELEKYRNLLTQLPDLNLDTSNIPATKKQEILYENNKGLADELEIPYNEDIPKFLKEAKKKIDLQKVLIHREKLVNALATLRLPEDYSDLQSLREKYSELGRSKDLMQCPGCKASIYYKPGDYKSKSSLVLSTAEWKRDVDSELGNLKRIISRKEKEASLDVRRKEIEKELNELPDDELLHPRDYEILKRQYERGIKLTYYSAPLHSSSLLESVKKRKEIMSQIRYLEEALAKIPEIPPIEDVTDLRNQLNIYNNITIQIDGHNKRISSISSELQKLRAKAIPEIQERLFNLIDKQAKEVNALERAERAKIVFTESSKLRRLSEDIDLLTNRSQQLVRFRKVLEDTECSILQNTVSCINNILNKVCSQVFQDPIIVELRLYRELKSKKNSLKQEVNIIVHYKSANYDLGQLSGGEMDRISFALTLALSSVSKSNILFLDETMGGLDLNTRQSCLASIKEILDKIVVCIDHESIEGNYDQMIGL